MDRLLRSNPVDLTLDTPDRDNPITVQDSPDPVNVQDNLLADHTHLHSPRGNAHGPWARFQLVSLTVREHNMKQDIVNMTIHTIGGLSNQKDIQPH